MVFSLLSLVVLVPHAVGAAAAEEDVANTANSSTAPITWDSFPPFTVDQIAELKFNITDPQDIPNLRILLVQINGELGDTISTVNTVLERGKEYKPDCQQHQISTKDSKTNRPSRRATIMPTHEYMHPRKRRNDRKDRS